MKAKRIAVSVLAIVLLVYAGGWAAEQNPTITFNWEQDAETFSVLTRWQLGIGNEAGGPYTQFIGIAKSNPINGSTYGGSAEVVYSGTPGQSVTKYFIMRACISGDDTECSAWSNEVAHTVGIPIGPPLNLRKVSAVISIRINAIRKQTVGALEPTGSLAALWRDE